MADSSIEKIIVKQAFKERLNEVIMEYEVKLILKELNKIAEEIGKEEKIKIVMFEYVADKLVEKIMQIYGVYVKEYIQRTPNITLNEYQWVDLLLFDIVSPYKLEHQAFFDYSKIRHTLVAYFQPYALITLERTFPTEFPEYVLKIKDKTDQLEKMAALYEVLDELISHYEVRKKKSYLKILFEQEPYKLNLKQIETLLNIMYYIGRISPKEIREVIHDFLLGFQ